ncbi:hypothetical protein BOX15_Mlig004701g1, partial [Macrostomum lignano]
CMTTNQVASTNGAASSPAAAAAAASLRWNPNNLKLGREVGEGTFSTVYMAQIVENGSVVHNEVAVKVCDQSQIMRKKAVDVIMTEKEALTRVDHKLFVRLICTMKDKERLYFVLTYCPRGELLSWIRKLGNFSIECARFYCGELLEACEYLNSIGIVHRDVKPENCYLMQDFQLKLGDFGSAFITGFPKCPSYTGTPHYAAPEMLLQTAKGDHTVLYTMDLWAIGCCLFQFLSGRPPFRGRDDYSVMQQAVAVSYTFPDQFDPVAKDLVTNLLVKEAADRLGSPSRGGFDAVKSHEFFTGLPFGQLVDMKPPELAPNLPPVMEPDQEVDWANVPLGYSQGVRQLLNAELMATGEQQKRLSAGSGGAPIDAQNKASETERLRREQEMQNPFHRFCRQQLIIRQGYLYKRRGLFARKRMFLLTFGPHLFYVDAEKMELKGEVPWSGPRFMQFERRTGKLFYIHVVNRTYCLEDPAEQSDAWIEELQRVQRMYFKDDP